MNTANNQPLTTPVLFLIFNPPDTTKKVFKEIRQAKPEKLFISADGPRTDKLDDKIRCQAARKITENIDWPCEIYRKYEGKNLGCKIGVSSGIDWFFDNVEQGIILEDDCVPHQNFFTFSEKMLTRYKDNERVMMISGGNFVSGISFPTDYFFSRYFAIWGWATWRHTWKNYDITMNKWPMYRSQKKLKNYYPEFMVKLLTDGFDKAKDGSVDTWDVQWLYTCIFRDSVSIVPKVNLVSNIGLYGTHAKGTGRNNFLPTNTLDTENLKHPILVEPYQLYDNLFFKRNFYESRQVKLLRKFKHFVYLLSLFNKKLWNQIK